MRFDLVYFLDCFPKLGKSFGYTLFIILAVYAMCFVLGVLITAARLRKIPILSQICAVWLSFVRSMPMLVTMFLSYFALPGLLGLLGIDLELSLTAYVLVAMTFQYSPFMSEVLRPSYLAVERGQHEAAASIGMTGWQALRRVTAPQTLHIALPQLGATALRITGDSSLMFTIGVVDLMGQADIQIVTSYGIHKLESYIAVAVCYWIITIGITVLTHWAERYYDRFHIAASVRA